MFHHTSMIMHTNVCLWWLVTRCNLTLSLSKKFVLSGRPYRKEQTLSALKFPLNANVVKTPKWSLICVITSFGQRLHTFLDGILFFGLWEEFRTVIIRNLGAPRWSSKLLRCDQVAECERKDSSCMEYKNYPDHTDVSLKMDIIHLRERCTSCLWLENYGKDTKLLRALSRLHTNEYLIF